MRAAAPGGGDTRPLEDFLRAHPGVVSLAFVLGLLALWEGAAAARWLPTYIHAPTAIARDFWALTTDGGLLVPAAHSLRRALAGFAIGGSLGVLLGLLAGASKPFRDLFDLNQAFTHPVPKIALFPAVALVLGFTDSARILVISVSAFYPAYLNALNGAFGVNPRLFWVARNAGASRLRVFFQVLLPASLPRALVGLRISLMVAFVLMVATEVLGHSNGLGAQLMRAYREGEYGAMYAGIVAVAACGVLANAALQWATRRLLAWQAHAGVPHA